MNIDSGRPDQVVDDDTPIWRYMDLPKFVAMLATNSLHFTKLAKFSDDPYEGFGRATALPIPSGDSGAKWVTRSHPDGRTTQMSQAEWFADLSQRSAREVEDARELLYVNSWCRGPESFAMWEIYGASGRGIAVQSSISDYKRAVRFNVRQEQYRFSDVEYHMDINACAALRPDFSQGTVPVPGPGMWPMLLEFALHKRSCYDYEREWRAVLYQDHRPEIEGVDIAVDPDVLVGAVYVGPRSESFLYNAVSSIMEKFELRRPLVRSSLLCPPKKEAPASAG